MSSAFSRTLPARADLEQQKKQAKELFAAYKRGDDEARARVRAELPDKSPIALTDVQFVLAREYGFASWRALKEHIEAQAAEALPPVDQLKRAMRRARRRRCAPASRAARVAPHGDQRADLLVRLAGRS